MASHLSGSALAALLLALSFAAASYASVEITPSEPQIYVKSVTGFETQLSITIQRLDLGLYNISLSAIPDTLLDKCIKANLSACVQMVNTYNLSLSNLSTYRVQNLSQFVIVPGTVNIQSGSVSFLLQITGSTLDTGIAKIGFDSIQIASVNQQLNGISMSRHKDGSLWATSYLTSTCTVYNSTNNGLSWTSAASFGIGGDPSWCYGIIDTSLSMLYLFYMNTGGGGAEGIMRSYNISSQVLSGANTISSGDNSMGTAIVLRNGTIAFLNPGNAAGQSAKLHMSFNSGTAWANTANTSLLCDSQYGSGGGTNLMSMTQTSDSTLWMICARSGGNVSYQNVSSANVLGSRINLTSSNNPPDGTSLSATVDKNDNIIVVWHNNSGNFLGIARKAASNDSFFLNQTPALSVLPQYPVVRADVDTGQVYIAYEDTAGNNPSDQVRYIRSGDFGLSWNYTEVAVGSINVYLVRYRGEMSWMRSEHINYTDRQYLDFITYNASKSWYDNFTLLAGNQAPAVNNVTANLTSASALQLMLDVSDPDGSGDLSACSIGAVANTTISAGICRLAASLVFSGQVWINDTGGLNASKHINYSFAVTGEQQDTSRTTEANGTAYTRFLFNQTITNLTQSHFAFCRSGWNQNVSSLAANATNYVVGCNNSDVVTKARARFNVSDSQVVAGSNSTGFLEVLVNNTDTVISYDNLLVNVSTGGLVPAGWTLNDSQSYQLNLSNGTTRLRNSTIATSAPLVAFLSPQAADCTGFTVFTDYCSKDTTEDLGGGRTRHTTTVRHVINSTDSLVRSFNVLVPMPLSRFTNWASRNSGSESGAVNSSSNNLSIASDDSNVNLTIGTNHSTSSISPGYYLADVTYTWDTVVSQSPSPGGGGGGPEIVTIVLLPNRTFSISPVERTLFLRPGELALCSPEGAKCKEFVLSNPTSEPFDVTLRLEAFFADPSVGWAVFRIGENAVTQMAVTVPAGTPANPGRMAFNVSVNVPLAAELTNYQFYIVATADRAPTVRVPVRVFLNEQAVIQGFFDAVGSFIGACWVLPRPIGPLTTICSLPAAAVLVVALFFTWAARSTWNNVRGSRRPRYAR
jgi:hypothetical protein